MTNASLALEFTPVFGADLSRCAIDAQRISVILGVNVAFKFNDVQCIAVPEGSADTLYHKFMLAVGKPGPIASSA